MKSEPGPPMAVEEINFGLFSGMHGGDLGFLEIRRNPIGVGVDQRHDLCADRSVLTDFEGEISDKPVDRRAQDGPVEVELSRRAVGDRLLIGCCGRVGGQYRILTRLV